MVSWEGPVQQGEGPADLWAGVWQGVGPALQGEGPEYVQVGFACEWEEQEQQEAGHA